MKITQLFQVEEPETGQRIDAYLAAKLAGEFTRSQLKRFFGSSAITINTVQCKPHTLVKEGDEINIDLETQKEIFAKPEAIPLDVVFEDDDLLIINKSIGMVVHPAAGNQEHTLVNAVLHHVGSQITKNQDPIRPGIVHRLDKDTSGLIIVAKNDKSHTELAKKIKHRTVERIYWAVVKGIVQHDEGECQEPVGRAFLSRKKVVVQPSGGKSAHTFYKVLKRFKNNTLIEVKLKTGRTHQIRVHMAHLGHPVLGDLLYGVQNQYINRQALHAKSLAFTHPATKEPLSFTSEIPADMQHLINELEKD